MKFRKEIMRFWLPFAAICFFFSGCYSDNEYFLQEGTTGQIEEFFNRVQSDSNLGSFNSDSGTTIITDDNSILTVPASAFQDANGNVVSNEAVHMEYIMLKDKGLLVLNNKPTISNGQLLESGGVFKFDALRVSDGEQLFLRDGYGISVKTTSETQLPNMQLFTGGEDDFGFNWDVVNAGWGDVQINEWAFQDSSEVIEGVGYEFLVESLDWINCDVFYDIPDDEKTGACVVLPEIYTNLNTAVFVIFTDINSVTGLYGTPETMKFCDPYNSIPIGYDVTFITISAMGNDEYHFGMKNALITDNHEETIVPEVKTLEEILDILGMF